MKLLKIFLVAVVLVFITALIPARGSYPTVTPEPNLVIRVYDEINTNHWFILVERDCPPPAKPRWSIGIDKTREKLYGFPLAVRKEVGFPTGASCSFMINYLNVLVNLLFYSLVILIIIQLKNKHKPENKSIPYKKGNY